MFVQGVESSGLDGQNSKIHPDGENVDESKCVAPKLPIEPVLARIDAKLQFSQCPLCVLIGEWVCHIGALFDVERGPDFCVAGAQLRDVFLHD